jgi:urease accessory protein
LSLEFAVDRDGRSYLSRQFASYPYHVCRVKYLDAADQRLATLYVQSCSGGIYEDDALSAELIVRRNAMVHVTTQASTIIHTMPRGMASQDTRILAEEDSYSEFLPDPQILFAESNFESTIRVSAARTATVVLCDSILTHDPLGRDGFPKHCSTTMFIEDDAGKQLAVDRLVLTGEAFSDRRPGVLGEYNALGTMLIVTADARADLIRTRVADLEKREPQGAIGITQLPHGAGYMCRLLARDGVDLKRSMTALWQIVRLVLKGHHAAVRRK